MRLAGRQNERVVLLATSQDTRACASEAAGTNTESVTQQQESMCHFALPCPSQNRSAKILFSSDLRSHHFRAEVSWSELTSVSTKR